VTHCQQITLRRVILSHRAGKWYRASGSGERVTLASLYYRKALARRVWRGKEGSRDAANEYQLGEMLRAEFGLEELS
jgi:hypothetical protein